MDLQNIGLPECSEQVNDLRIEHREGYWARPSQMRRGHGRWLAPGLGIRAAARPGDCCAAPLLRGGSFPQIPSCIQRRPSACCVARRLNLVDSQHQRMVFDELTRNLRKAELEYLNFSQVLVGIVNSFLFSSRYYSAYGLADAFGENGCGFGSSVGKFCVRQQQAAVKAYFPFQLFAGTTSFTGVWHYSLPAASIPPSPLPCSACRVRPLAFSFDDTRAQRTES
jgi:hypothetical protein